MEHWYGKRLKKWISFGCLLASISAPSMFSQDTESLGGLSKLISEIAYTAKGRCDFPVENIGLISEPGSDPRTFVNTFTFKFALRNANYECFLQEVDGNNNLMGDIHAGFDGVSYFYNSLPLNHLLTTTDQSTAQNRFIWVVADTEVVLRPFSFAGTNGPGNHGPSRPTIQSAADIRKALVMILKGRGLDGVSKDYSIEHDDNGVIWNLKFDQGNLYPKEFTLTVDGKVALRQQVKSWGKDLGGIAFPKIIEVQRFLKDKLIKVTKVEIEDMQFKVESKVKVPYKSADGIHDLDTDTIINNR